VQCPKLLRLVRLLVVIAIAMGTSSAASDRSKTHESSGFSTSSVLVVMGTSNKREYFTHSAVGMCSLHKPGGVVIGLAVVMPVVSCVELYSLVSVTVD
jgi:hypothetical protein